MPVEPDSPHFAPLAAGAEQVMRRATRSVAALAEVWVVAERYQQELAVLEVVFAESGVRAGTHGSCTAVLIPLDEPHEMGQVSIFLGRDHYTILVTAHADGLLAALCKLIGVPAPAAQWGQLPTVAHVADHPGAALGEEVGCKLEALTNSSFSTQMRLVDNTDARFSLSGTATCWSNTTNGFHRSGLEKSVTYYSYCNGTTGSPTRTGTWVPDLPVPGTYWVYAFAPNHSGITLTANATYRVYSNGSLVGTVAVNQNGYNNDWVRLGSFYLLTSNSYVVLTNQVSDSQRVAYDAVMFVRDF